MAFGVGIEEMIGAGVILIDALLNETHPENARVKIKVLLSGTGDSRDVMESGDWFQASPSSMFLER
jgi:hypothetical protein